MEEPPPNTLRVPVTLHLSHRVLKCILRVPEGVHSRLAACLSLCPKEGTALLFNPARPASPRPGSRPGMSSLATTPATNPNTTQLAIPKALPPP